MWARQLPSIKLNPFFFLIALPNLCPAFSYPGKQSHCPRVTQDWMSLGRKHQKVTIHKKIYQSVLHQRIYRIYSDTLTHIIFCGKLREMFAYILFFVADLLECSSTRCAFDHPSIDGADGGSYFMRGKENSDCRHQISTRFMANVWFDASHGINKCFL